MGYVDLALRPAATLAADGSPRADPPRADPPRADATPRLSALEWSVVALARDDHPNSLREPGRLSRALRGLFGRGAASRLADPRLEALRRLAVFAWAYGYRLPVSELKSFLRSGFSAEQLDSVLTSVSAARVAVPRRPAA